MAKRQTGSGKTGKRTTTRPRGAEPKAQAGKKPSRKRNITTSKASGGPSQAAGPSLASKYRAVARQWHPSKNGDLTPKDLKPASRKKVWWTCSKGHEWQAVVYSRTLNGTGCPYCSGKRAGKDNCLATLYPDVAKDWHPSKNGSLTPEGVTKGSKKRIWWRCTKGHEWRAPVYDRTNGKGCPYCAHRALGDDNNLAAIRPDIAGEWHPTKNGKLKPTDVFPAAGIKVWWRCSHGHEWQTTVNSRTTLGTGCPYCSGRKISKERSLAVVHRSIAREWDNAANGDLTPKDVSELSKKVVAWKCRKGHTWQASVRSRTLSGTGCPQCEAEKVSKSTSGKSSGKGEAGKEAGKKGERSRSSRKSPSQASARTKFGGGKTGESSPASKTGPQRSGGAATKSPKKAGSGGSRAKTKSGTGSGSKKTGTKAAKKTTRKTSKK